MDETLPAAVIASIAQQAAQVASLLAPVGVAMSGSFITLAIILMGASIMTGGGFLSQLVEMCLWAAGALFLCGAWPEVISVCLTTSDQVLALFGYGGGPASLFTAAAAVADRLAAEPLGWEWSVSGTAGAMFRGVLLAVITPIVLIALAIPGLLALLAQVTLLLGAAAAPLVVGGIAFSITRPLAFGAINFMVAATLKIIVLSLVSTIFAAALQAQLNLPGANAAITMAGLAGLLMTAVLAAVAGFSASSIAGNLVGYGVGSLGLSSFARPAAMVSNMTTASGAAMSAAGSAAASGGAAAGRAAGRVTSVGAGSAFP